MVKELFSWNLQIVNLEWVILMRTSESRKPHTSVTVDCELSDLLVYFLRLGTLGFGGR